MPAPRPGRPHGALLIEAGASTVDAPASITCVSWGFDPESSGMSVMEYDLSVRPGGEERVHGYLFPPPKMLSVLVRHVMECRADLVLVAPNPPEPCPAWRASIGRHVRMITPLVDEFCADRMHEGWKAVKLPGCAAFFLSFD